MKRMLRYLFCAALLLTLGSCLPEGDFDERMLSDHQLPSLTVKGRTVFEYDPHSCQESWSPTTLTYRSGTDTMSDWFEIRLSNIPSELDRDIMANLSWTGRNSEESLSRLHFELRATDSDGHAWLWCRRQQILVVLRLID